MFPALELFRMEKEKERRELKRLSSHMKCIGTLLGTKPGSLSAGEALFLPMRGNIQRGTGASGSKYKIA